MQKRTTKKSALAIFLVLLFFVILPYIFLTTNSSQAALLNVYNKINGGTLQAGEWNNLLADFVSRNNGGDVLTGNYGINTATSSSYALDIDGSLRATNFTGAFSGTISSANISAGLFGSNTGGGNYQFPNNISIGIGSSTSPSVINIANNRWISALNSAGTAYVNMFKVNANDEIEVGSALNIGNFQFAADSGFNTFVDMPVTSASFNGSVQGYVMKIDGDNILSVYSESDGNGGTRNRRVGVNTSAPQYDLDVNGILNANSLYIAGQPFSGGKWSDNGTSIYYNLGYVGINTTNPEAHLDVDGLIKMRNPTITANEDVINKGYLDSALASTTAGIITQVATSSFWQGSLTGSIYSANTGNVGVGATNPAQKLSVQKDALGVTVTDTSGLGLINTSAATAGAQQISPAIKWNGQGWATTPLSSQSTSFISYLLPVQGSTNPSANLIFASSINGGAYTSRLTLSSTGALSSISSIAMAGALSGATTGSFSGAITSTQSLTTTPTNGFVALAGSASVGTPVRISPSVVWSGSAWNTTPTAATKINAIEAYLLPVNGAVTSGSLVFANRTVNGVANNSEIMRLTTAGNVGINTTNPTTRLSVVGDGTYSIDAGNNRIGNVAAPVNATDAVNRTYLDSAIATATSSISTLWGGTVGGNVWNLNSGNVGVGVTNPNFSLDVDGIVKTNGPVISTGASSWPTTIGAYTAMYYYTTGDAGRLFAYNGSAYKDLAIGDWNGGNPNIMLKVGGKVGIGTGSPSNQLSVAGGADFSDNVGIGTSNPGTNRLNIQGGNFLFGDALNVDANATFYVGPNGSFTVARNSAEYIETKLTSGYITMLSTSKPFYFGTFDANSLSLRTNNASRLTIDADGNVGIATTTPGTRLTVVGDGTYSIDAGNNRIGNVAAPVNATDAVNRTYLDSAIATATSSISTLWGGTVGGNTWNLNSGNVGVGTTNPTRTLDVNGVLGLLNNNSISSSEVTLDSYSSYGLRVQNDVGYINITPLNGGWAHIYTDRPNFIFNKSVYAIGGKFASYSTADLTLSSGGSSNDLVIKNSTGNVGIATTNPGTRLSVVGDGTYSIDAGNNRIGNVSAPVSATDAANRSFVESAIATATSSISTLWGGTVGGNVWNLNSGNVGVGTTAPIAQLDVSGTMNVSGTTTFSGNINNFYQVNSPYSTVNIGRQSSQRFSIYVDDYTGTMTSYQQDETTNNHIWAFNIISPTSGRQDYRFRNNGTELLTIDKTGNVGIGTTNPTLKLDVDGIIASGNISGSGELRSYQAAASNYISLKTLGSKSGLFRSNTDFFAYYDTVNGNTNIEATYGGSSILFNVQGSEKMRVANGGNVGIATTNPGTRLSVVGDGTYSIDAGNNRIGNVSAPVNATDAANRSFVESAIATATSSISTLWGGAVGSNVWNLNSGNVGIGITNPTFKLDINGTARFSDDVRLDSGKNLIFYDHNGSFPTADGGFLWDLNNDSAKIYAQQPSSDNIDLVFKLTDNALSTDRFLYWIDEWRGESFDTYPLVMDATKIVFNYPTVGGTGVSKDTNFYILGQGASDISNAYFFGDASSGNVGIATTTPGTRLTVVGDGTYSIDAGNNRIGNVSAPVNATDAVNKTYVDSAAGGGVGAGTSGQTLRHDGTSWVANSNLFNNGINIGIGTTAPNKTLQVMGGLAVDSGFNTGVSSLYLSHTGTSNQHKAAIFTTYTGGYGRSSSMQFAMNSVMDGSTVTTADAKMTILEGGNVGIGTTNPLLPFQVNGKVAIGDSVSTARLNSLYGPRAVNLIDSNATLRVWRFDSTVSNASQLELGIGTNDDFGNAANKVWMLGAWGGGYFTINDRTGGGNGVERLRIDSSGNVGINTTNPGTRLSVVGDGTYSIDAGNNRIGNVSAPVNATDAANRSFVESAIATATSSISTLWGGSVGGNVWSLNSGNVGIGTTAPTSNLHVANTFQIGTDGVSGSRTATIWAENGYEANLKFLETPTYGMGIRYNSSSNYLSIDRYVNSATPTGSLFSFRDSGDIELDGGNFYIDHSSSSIGIGTTNPGTRLSVVGDGTYSIDAGNNRIGNVSAPVNSTDAANRSFVESAIATATSSISTLWGGTVGGNVWNLNSGNVGIGTTNPRSGLDVGDNDIYIGNHPTTRKLYFGNDTNYFGRGTISTTQSNLGLFNTYATGYITLNTNGSERLRVNYDGNVGIATTNPGTRLSVVGDGTYSIDAGNNRIGNVAAPVNATDAVNRSYLDSAIATATSSISTLWGGTTGGNVWNLNSGNVGIGTTDPGTYKLKVVGNVAVTGTFQTQTGSDFAEEFSVSSELEAGTVVVMDNNGYKSVKSSTSAYDNTVIGIVSDNPSIIAGRVDSEKKVIVAMVGVVSVKVSDINGSIRKGDLLTTSNISGYAMKSTIFKPGTVIGKALENLSAKKGIIKVLVNLQ